MKRKRNASLARSDWLCIWCLKADGPFRRREHVIPEALGGTDVLPKGAVCDPCNSGVLAEIDSQMQLHPAVLIAKLMLGRKSARRGQIKELKPGFRIDHETGDGLIDIKQLGPESRLDFCGEPGGPAQFSVSSTGPSKKIGNEHLTRGLHKIGYNALAHRYGSAKAIWDFSHLRQLVLDFKDVIHRPFLLTSKMDEREIRDAERSRTRYEILERDGQAEVVVLHFGLRATVALGLSVSALKERTP